MHARRLFHSTTYNLEVMMQESKSRIAGLLLVCVVCLCVARNATGFGGESQLDGYPWHHQDITLRALAGDAVLPGHDTTQPVLFEGVGFTADAAMDVAWHAVNLDNYLYSPMWWASAESLGGRFKASMAIFDEMVKLHFDDTFTMKGMKDNWVRYASGTIIALYWAYQNGDVAAARHILGVSAHAVQDFYSHSNWVNEPARVSKTWFDFDPAQREGMRLYSGAYELPDSMGVGSHGKINMACTVNDLAASKLRAVSEVISAACEYGLVGSAASYCASQNNCNNPEIEKLDSTFFEEPLKLVFDPVGIALDSSAMARVQAKNRRRDDYDTLLFANARDGLDNNFEVPDLATCNRIVHYGFQCATDERAAVEGCSTVQNKGECRTDADRLFAAAKQLAVRSTAQWMVRLGSVMKDLGAGDFWESVKTKPRDMTTVAVARTAPFENFNRFPLQFLSAGPYPVANEPNKPDAPQSAAGTYLRIHLRTSAKPMAGTDADVYVSVNGKEYRLDYLPTDDQEGKVTNPLLVYNDFEANDETVYVVGPIENNDRPDAILLGLKNGSINDALNAEYIINDIKVSIKNLMIRITSTLEDDKVGETESSFSRKEIDGNIDESSKILGGEMNIDNEGEGHHKLKFTIKRVSEKESDEDKASDVRVYNVTLDKFTLQRESDELGEDEPYFFFSATSVGVNGVGARVCFKKGPFDLNSGGEAALGESFDFRIARHDLLNLSLQAWEEDVSHPDARSNNQLAFCDGIKRNLEEQASSLFERLAAATTSDWELAEAKIFAFQRDAYPAAGMIYQGANLGVIGSGEMKVLPLDWGRLRPLLKDGAPGLDQW